MEKHPKQSYLVQVTLTEQISSYYRVTDETLLNFSSTFLIYTQNLINNTKITSVGNVQYLEGGEGRCQYDEGTDYNSEDHIILSINAGFFREKL